MLIFIIKKIRKNIFVYFTLHNKNILKKTKMYKRNFYLLNFNNYYLIPKILKLKNTNMNVD